MAHRIFARSHIIRTTIGLIVMTLLIALWGDRKPVSIQDRTLWSADADVNPETVALAFDNNPQTYWSTQTGMRPGMYFQIDLGHQRRVAEIGIDISSTPHDFPRAYQLAVSTDNINWIVADSQGLLSPTSMTITVAPLNARYIRLIQTGITLQDMPWSIPEIQIYEQRLFQRPLIFALLTVLGIGALMILAVNSLIGRKYLPQKVAPIIKHSLIIILLILAAWGVEHVQQEKFQRIGDTGAWSATSNFNAPAAGLAFDGWQDTRWTSQTRMEAGMFFLLDLGREHLINKLYLDAGIAQDAPETYRLEVSLDQQTWSTVSITTGSGRISENVFTPVNARFLKITVLEHFFRQHWWSIHDLRVYGPHPSGSVAQIVALAMFGICLSMCCARKKIHKTIYTYFQTSAHYLSLLWIAIGGSSLALFLWMHSQPAANYMNFLHTLGWRLLLYTGLLFVVWAYIGSIIAAITQRSIHNILSRNAYSYMGFVILVFYWRPWKYQFYRDNSTVLLVLLACAGMSGINLTLFTDKFRFRRVIPAIILFVMFLSLYLYNLNVFETLIWGKGYGIFAADMKQIADAMRHISFLGDMQKHLPFALITSPFVKLFQTVLLRTQEQAIFLVVAIISAANIVAVFHLLRKYVCPSTLTAIWGACLYAFFSANLVIFSLPETYALSNLAILGYFSLLLAFQNHLTPGTSLWLAAASGIAALFNPPLLSLMLIHLWLLFRTFPVRTVLLSVIGNLITGIAVFCVPHIIVHGWRFYEFFFSYSDNYSSFTYLLEFEAIATVSSNFFLFSVINPLNALENLLRHTDIRYYFSSSIGIILILMYGLYLIYIVYTVLKTREPLLVGIVAWMAVMTLFYIYFCPSDTILFACQLLFPLLLIGIRTLKRLRVRTNLKYAVFALFSLLLIIKNSLALYAPIP